MAYFAANSMTNNRRVACWLLLHCIVSHSLGASISLSSECGVQDNRLTGGQVDCMMTSTTSVYDTTTIVFNVEAADTQQFDIVLVLREISGSVAMLLMDSRNQTIASTDIQTEGDDFLSLPREKVTPGQHTIKVITQDRVASFSLTVQTSSLGPMKMLGATDKALLQRFYQLCCPKTGGPPICQTLSNWLSAKTTADDLCHTPPNMCTTTEDEPLDARVVSLYLNNQESDELGDGLTCASPPNIFGQMSELATLDLSYNRLTWSIPKLGLALSQATGLKHVMLHDNELQDTLDCTLMGPNVQYLSLSDNQVLGNIPDCFFKSSSLKVLRLDANMLNGPLPDVFTPDMPLKVLGLSGQEGTSGRTLSDGLPASLAQLQSLVDLDVSLNQLEGTIPSLPMSLQIVDLGDNAFVGFLPDSLRALPNLKALLLYNLTLTGNLPAGVASLPSLIWLYINNISLAGPLPGTWNAPQLRDISIQNANLSGQLPAALATQPSLVHVHVAGNQLTSLDNFAKSLKATNTIVYFNASNNMLTKIPNLSKLAVFTNMAAPIPSEWLDSAMILNSLDLSNNNIVAAFPTWLPNSLVGMSTSALHVDVSGGNTLMCPKSVPAYNSQALAMIQAYGLMCHDTSTKQQVSFWTAAQQTKKDASGLPIAIIAALAVGGILGISIVILLVLLLTRCCKNRRDRRFASFTDFKEPRGLSVHAQHWVHKSPVVNVTAGQYHVQMLPVSNVPSSNVPSSNQVSKSRVMA